MQPQAQSSTFVLRPPPATLDELVADLTLVFVGTVGSLVNEQTFAGYDEKGKLIKAKEQNLPSEVEVPIFDYVLQIEQIVKGDEIIQTDNTVTLRMFDKGVVGQSTAGMEFPPSLPGDRHLFFLRLNPDNKTYGLKYGPMSRLSIDGPVVTQSDNERSPVVYDGDKKPSEFIEKVKDVAKKQKDR